MADDILINKADGENRPQAEQARLEQQASLSCLQPATPGWKTEAALCSARTGEGIPHVWQRIERFFRELEPKAVIAKRRQQQAVDWLTDLTREELQRRFERHPRVQARWPGMPRIPASRRDHRRLRRAHSIGGLRRLPGELRL